MTTFNQLFSSGLYETVPQAGDLGWCGYIFNPASGVSPPVSGVSLQDLFSNKYPYGIFIFCSDAPPVTDTASADAFVKQVLNYMISTYGAHGEFTNFALAWLQNPNTINSKTITAVTLDYITSFSVVSPLSYSPSANLTLAISTGAPCSLNGDLFNFYNPNGQTPSCLNVISQFANNEQGNVFNNPVQNIYVPTSGPLTGCLDFMLPIPSTSYNFPANTAALNYFYNGGSFNFYLFDSAQAQNAGTYYMSFDPNNQLNAGGCIRTFMVPMSAPDQPTLLPSGFSTDSGLQLGLSSVLNLTPYEGTTVIWTPSSKTGLFVYTNNQGAGIEGINYDLILQGQFSMSFWNNPSAPLGTVNLLCGLSGLETFSFQPATMSYTGDILSFWPGNPANAAFYQPPSSGADPSNSAAQLDKTFTTSWISIGKGVGGSGDNLYYSQPTGASLYALGYGVNKSSPGLLGFFEPVACILASGSDPVPVPMVPYRLLNLTVTANQADYSNFELKVLATNRKSTLEPTVQTVAQTNREVKQKNKLKGTTQTGATSVYSTSPQGLLVEVDTTNNEWLQLVLARNTNINEKSDPEVTMEFLELNSTLQSAFQTNQQFLVMSWNKPITKGGKDYVLYGTNGDKLNFQNEMFIEGWPFTAAVPLDEPNGVFTNVLIFKFCEGALVDWIKDTSTWTSPGLFNSLENNNLTQLQSWLSDYCANAIAKYNGGAGDMNYYYFSSIVQNPNWNGILLLECDISVLDFPPELQGLLAGIDLSRFYGHHFGINVNHISTDQNGQLTMGPVSSLFGLIDYTDQVFDQYNDNIAEYLAGVTNPAGDYNYKVLSLKVLFENSLIQNFDSYVQLAINKLFGTTVTALNNANIIIFKGTYEDQNGQPNYIFNETGDNLLPLSSNVMNGVEIVKASFVTEQPQDGVASTMVYVKFSFWGFMNFKQQSFDLYSFGSPQQNGSDQFIPGDGLAYSKMAIDMNFALETSTVQFFSFDVSQMAFDLGQSNWREASLYGHFPLELTGILTGDSSSQPSSQGYIPLPIPGMVGGSTWAGDWYGMVFNLNMGTMGDLTNSLGFNSTMLMVWTSGANGQMGAMLHLPGLSTQAKMLSLQSVLSLNIGNLQLQAAQNQPGGNPVAYMMSLNQITLKFLSFSFPPSGAVNFYLFGDPDAGSSPSSLGWYLGYNKSST